MTNLRALAGVLSSRWREPSTCEACGDQFTCGATLAGCWCSEIKLSDETRGELRTQYERCLCRPCVENLAAKEEQVGADDQIGA